jgi:heat shock protein HslJ
MPTRGAVLALLGLLAVVGCEASDALAPVGRPSEWTLVPIPGSLAPTLRFERLLFGDDAGQAGGHDGCNFFSATFITGPGGILRLSDFVKTRALCVGPGNGLEGPFLDYLMQVIRYERRGDTLDLFTPSGARLRFARTP